MFDTILRLSERVSTVCIWEMTDKIKLQKEEDREIYKQKGWIYLYDAMLRLLMAAPCVSVTCSNRDNSNLILSKST